MTALVLKPQDQSRFVLAALVLFGILVFFVTYSVMKYNALSNRSLVKDSVVMRVIQHGVKSVCPRCGTKGVPSCPTDQASMYWNGYQGQFVCPACGGAGFPQCPRCRHFMSWIESQV
ncbi:MAG: hypothetical protein HQL11_00450 [Candidatus Omnitrophica bacterium]|nr:hypothetical protein [Candidatus Omnitrophota bacterium]